jgi:hypothetical protein
MKLLLVMSLVVVSLFADTINFKNGATLKGSIVKEDKSTLTISIEGKETIYALKDIQSIQRDKGVSAPPPPPAAVSAPPSASLEVAAGTVLHVNIISTIDTNTHSKGDQFKAQLETALLASNGAIVAPKGSDLYGVVVDASRARRVVGQSKMVVTFETIVIDGKRVPITTNSLNIMAPENEGRDSVKKVARGAAIGALINGSDGAGDGAKVGVGLAMLTRGKSAGMAAGTLFDFTLTSPLSIK